MAVPPGPFGAACVSPPIPDEIYLAALEELAALFGWPIRTATPADLSADAEAELDRPIER
jgi:hypothetical protein